MATGVSLDELYQDGALQKLFPSVYSSVMDDDEELEQPDAEEPPVPPTEPPPRKGCMRTKCTLRNSNHTMKDALPPAADEPVCCQQA